MQKAYKACEISSRYGRKRKGISRIEEENGKKVAWITDGERRTGIKKNRRENGCTISVTNLIC